MNDEEYEVQQARVQALFSKWVKPLGLGWWVITTEWVREYKNAEPKGKVFGTNERDVCLNCSASWKYGTATIRCYLPLIADMSDTELEQSIVHELMHIMVNECRVDGDDWLDHEERVCTTLAKAFLWLRDSLLPEKGPAEAAT